MSATSKPKVFMVCDSCDGAARNVKGALNIGVEFMGNCTGRILHEDGTVIGHHHSSTLDWLRLDLRSKLDDPDKYEIIDQIK